MVDGRLRSLAVLARLTRAGVMWLLEFDPRYCWRHWMDWVEGRSADCDYGVKTCPRCNGGRSDAATQQASP